MPRPTNVALVLLGPIKVHVAVASLDIPAAVIV